MVFVFLILISVRLPVEEHCIIMYDVCKRGPLLTSSGSCSVITLLHKATKGRQRRQNFTGLSRFTMRPLNGRHSFQLFVVNFDTCPVWEILMHQEKSKDL